MNARETSTWRALAPLLLQFVRRVADEEPSPAKKTKAKSPKSQVCV